MIIKKLINKLSKYFDLLVEAYDWYIGLARHVSGYSQLIWEILELQDRVQILQVEYAIFSKSNYEVDDQHFENLEEVLHAHIDDVSDQIQSKKQFR